MSNEVLRPSDETDLREIVAEAAANGMRLAIRGGGSKTGIGRPETECCILEMRGLSGVVDYDPPELMLTVRAGTPLSEVQALVSEQGQMLAFEPFDHGPIFGRAAGAATIGGVVAAGVSGSQRISYGAARDHLAGARAVSGRGELFVCGAKVVKNVTGYDLPKLLTGSWGRLAAITELTLKLLPAPRVAVTCALRGLDPQSATAAMAAAMGSQADVAAAAHIPNHDGMTLFRIQGFPASVRARCRLLLQHLGSFGAAVQLDPEDAEAAWSSLRRMNLFAPQASLWRISIPSSACASCVMTLEAMGARWVLDWAGALAWVAFEGDASVIRDIAQKSGGHAQLVRASGDRRAQVPAFHPPEPGIRALEERMRRAFDPQGVFETGRF